MAVEQRTTTSGGGNGFLYFAVGALIVAVGVLAWMFYQGESNRSRSDTALERVADSVSDAAKDIGDSAKDAARNIPTPQPTPSPTAPPATPG
jgi:predicted negative regulator of RcsB-dependent stress response